MEVKEKQPSNAESPMEVTELGMVIERREDQANAEFPMVVTFLPLMAFYSVKQIAV